jgi:hypothetical protein
MHMDLKIAFVVIEVLPRGCFVSLVNAVFEDTL